MTADTEPIAQGAERLRLILTMAEFFKYLGYTDIRARAHGFPNPAVFEGTKKDHRPDITCRQRDHYHTGIILDCVTSEMVDQPRMKDRLTLLESAARAWAAELHFATLSADHTEYRLRRRLEVLDVKSNFVWGL